MWRWVPDATFFVLVLMLYVKLSLGSIVEVRCLLQNSDPPPLSIFRIPF